MTGPSVLPHIRCEKCKVLLRKLLDFGRDRELFILLLTQCKEAAHGCRGVWSVRTGKKNSSCSVEVFLRLVLWSHVPERCAKRTRILTDRIVKMHAHPAAHGGFSDIWSCELRYKQKPPKRVAVKAIRPAVASEEDFQVKQKAVKQELRVWRGLRHQNILRLYGITGGFGPFPAFVCPWADNGTLSEYLEKFETRLDLKRRVTLLGDIAAGLQYLHSHEIAHGDISDSNILITSKGQAWLSDFGLSTLIEQVSDATVSGISLPGNVRWAAPELFDGCGEGRPALQLSSTQADVYSFGSIMLQTLSGKLPFHGVRRIAQIVIMVSHGYQPPRESRWDGGVIPDELWKFVQRCWAEPWKRPSSKEIVDFIGCQLSGL